MDDLEFFNVGKAYGATRVFESFSGRFRARHVTGIVGPNGAGKTTLLRIAAGLQKPDAGTVVVGSSSYYGGFDSVPVNGRVNALRAALGLSPGDRAGNPHLRSLSRGQLHQVGLDASLEMKRSVVLLDEPWTALEPASRERLNHALRSRAESGATVVCSSHDLDEVRRAADDLLLFHGGKMEWHRSEDFASGAASWDEILQRMRGAR